MNHAFDDDFNFDNAPNNSENIDMTLELQSNEDVELSKKKSKPKDKNEKAEQSNGKASKKQYSCNKCDRTFACSTNLKKHEHIHTGMRPFKCSLCDKS